jgi:hypothetical protein
MSSQQVLPPISPEEEALREERRAIRFTRRRQQRRARLSVWSSIGLTVLLLLVMGFAYLQVQHLVSANTLHPPISGLSCDSMEQNGYHIHVHFTIYINGQPLTIPAGIGIPTDGTCFYWMHTHTDDGIIHIEAPQKLHNLALDDFMTLWQQGFANLNFPPQMTQSSGWKIFVNGKPFNGVVTSPLYTEVTFQPHDAVTLEYGSPNPPPDIFYAFPAGL